MPAGRPPRIFKKIERLAKRSGDARVEDCSIRGTHLFETRAVHFSDDLVQGSVKPAVQTNFFAPGMQSRAQGTDRADRLQHAIESLRQRFKAQVPLLSWQRNWWVPQHKDIAERTARARHPAIAQIYHP